MIFRLYKDKHYQPWNFPGREIWYLHIYKEKLPDMFVYARRGSLEFSLYRLFCQISYTGIHIWFTIHKGIEDENEELEGHYSRGIHFWRKKYIPFKSDNNKRVQLGTSYGYRY